MFDTDIYTSLRDTASSVAAAREHTPLATGIQLCDALRHVQKTLDILDGVRADLLARLEASDGYGDEGASTTAGWARRELRMGIGESRRHRKAGDTLQHLPKVAQALADGRIRAEHVHEFTAGITKLGASTVQDLEEILLPVAEDGEPADVRAVVTELHEMLHPDELDKKYARGMDRRDLKATRCGDGFHVTGFLDPIAGAKFQHWLKSVSAPAYDGDDRPPSARRCDAFARMLDHQTSNTDDTTGTGTGSSETPDDGPSSETSDRQPSGEKSSGPRRAETRLLVLADLKALLRLPGAQPATLAGFGHIGTQLLGYLTCGADVTALLADGLTEGPVPQANILNVGRTHRLATRAQRDAILARQHGICANPGCGSTLLEFHHVNWWNRDGGKTDLSNLVGICGSCHHRVHQNHLVIKTDGHGAFTFHRATGRIIDDHTRVTTQRVRQIIAHIRHAAASDTGTPRPQRRRQARRPQRRFDPSWLTPLTGDRSRGDHHLYEFIDQHATTRS